MNEFRQGCALARRFLLQSTTEEDAVEFFHSHGGRSLSQGQMQPHRRIDFVHGLARYLPDPAPQPFDRDSPDLLRLRLGVAAQSARAGPQPNLERVHLSDVPGDRYDRNHTTTHR